jgi:hypothetical protein
MTIRWPTFLRVPRNPDFEIGVPGSIYLRRWWVIPRNRLFNIYLHQFLRSDDDRALHDHPWCNVSILLCGSYLEHMPQGVVKLRNPWRPWAFWRLPIRLPTSAHRVELINGKPVWTLFLTGPKVRTWGFHCPRGWIPWTEFVAVREGGNSIGQGCGEP